jgi:hypothetical protein
MEALKFNRLFNQKSAMAPVVK